MPATDDHHLGLHPEKGRMPQAPDSARLPTAIDPICAEITMAQSPG
jgi:hypothetical protein